MTSAFWPWRKVKVTPKVQRSQTWRCLRSLNASCLIFSPKQAFWSVSTFLPLPKVAQHSAGYSSKTVNPFICIFIQILMYWAPVSLYQQFYSALIVCRSINKTNTIDGQGSACKKEMPNVFCYTCITFSVILQNILWYLTKETSTKKKLSNQIANYRAHRYFGGVSLNLMPFRLLTLIKYQHYVTQTTVTQPTDWKKIILWYWLVEIENNFVCHCVTNRILTLFLPGIEPMTFWSIGRGLYH